MDKIARTADILAVPFFLVLFLYFVYKPNKTKLEIVLMLFALSGLVIDSVFAYDQIYN